MSKTMRFKRALCALHSDEFPYAMDAVVITSMASGRDGYTATYGLLTTLKDEYVDVLCVLMYEGRDEYLEGCQYASDRIDDEFAKEWDCLGMDGESYARNIMAEKGFLSNYLRRGAYMYGIRDEL